jgi:hypothetical protein
MGSKEGVYNEGPSGCGSNCAAEAEPHGTANLLRRTLSAVVKSLSKKCMLHKNLWYIILAESIVQDIPNLPAHIITL